MNRRAKIAKLQAKADGTTGYERAAYLGKIAEMTKVAQGCLGLPSGCAYARNQARRNRLKRKSKNPSVRSETADIKCEAKRAREIRNARNPEHVHCSQDRQHAREQFLPDAFGCDSDVRVAGDGRR